MPFLARKPRVRQRRPIRTSEDLERASKELKLGQRRAYGWALLGLLVVQLLAADALMYLYAWKRHWSNVPKGVMQAWLAAAVVQLIGLVWVVVKHLFDDEV